MTTQRGKAKRPQNSPAQMEGAPGESPRGLPKSFLEPWILLLLKQWSGHGYWLLQSLKQFGIGPVDHTTLYKELRSLEKRGLVSSTWLTGDAGPARRTYALTEAGEKLLLAWADTVGQYQKMMSTFFQLYSNMLTGFPSVGPKIVPNGNEPLVSTQVQNAKKRKEKTS